MPSSCCNNSKSNINSHIYIVDLQLQSKKDWTNLLELLTPESDVEYPPMEYESGTTCVSLETSFIDEYYILQDHDAHIPGPSELTLQDQMTPSPSTNNPEHEQSDKQSHPSVNSSTSSQNYHSMTLNEIKNNPKYVTFNTIHSCHCKGQCNH